jgi:hypothetical protein
MTKLRYFCGAALGLALAASASAQDASAPPAYGSTSLNAGFAEDPTSVAVRAGGAIYAGNISDYCYGYITHQPSYNLNYTAGDVFDLYISATSDVDAVLAIQGPDGNWTCDDDGAGVGLNPGIQFENPQSGTYAIFVGTYGSGAGYEPAMLHISELGFHDANPFSRAPNATMAPSAGALDLRAGFSGDPRTVPVRAGGEVDASLADGMCWGYVDQAPDLWVDYDANDEFNLYISMQADADTTLMVRAPDGSWLCDDDTAGDLNPGLRIMDPQPGRYAVWGGRFSRGPEVDATIFVSELGYLGGVDTVPVLDYSLPSNYGSAQLSAGFIPDPHNVPLQAGGDVEVYEAVGQNCRGYATSAPDYDITYEAGSFDLYISASSDGDATLIVNAPDGSWWCDDDSAGDLNPGLRFDEPQSGRYDIWVGTYSEGPPQDAVLHISELGFGSEFIDAATLDYTLPSNYGSISLSGGFSPDPYVIDVLAGGNLEAESAADQSCRGYVTQAPDVELIFEPGALDLYISALSDNDTTLVINDPSGNWVCNDDGSSGVNPGIHFENPQAGAYHIWVGTYWDGDGAPARLAISELGFLED